MSSSHADLEFGTLDVHATDEESLARLHAYADAWSSAFLDGRLDEEKQKTWLEHSRADDVVLRYAAPRSVPAGTPRPVATFSSWDQEMNVGGPDLLPLHMITDVTVAATHRRRGLLQRLMGEDLADAAERGVPLAALTVSEGSIYGRFGFGPATRYRKVEVDVRPGRFRLRDLDDAGSLALVEPADAWPVMREVYASYLASTRGEVARPHFYGQVLSGAYNWKTGGKDRVLNVVLHLDRDGTPDGYAAYRPKDGDTLDECRIDLGDMVALNPTAYLRLWQFLADVDLISTVRGQLPVQDVLDHALVDPRTVRTREVVDKLWLRILDLPVALEARPWREEATVVLEVSDPLGHTEGRWRVTTQKGRARVERTDDSPGVSLSTDTLATLYLGDHLVPTLAGAGRLSGPDVETFAGMADHAGPPPYSKTGF